MSTTKFLGPTELCHKLLWACYYYARCFGLTAFGVKKIDIKSNQFRRNLQETIIIHNIDAQTSRSRRQQTKETLLHAYATKTLLWLHILLRIIVWCWSSYILLTSKYKQDYIFYRLICFHIATLFICPFLTAIVEICDREKILQSFNSLMRLIRDVKALHSSYQIFQWTHVTYVALTLFTFIFEIYLLFQCSYSCNTVADFQGIIAQFILFIEIWINIHAVTLLYVTIDALYGTLNHYMQNEFIPRLRVVQTLGQITTEAQVDRLLLDTTKFMDLFKSVQIVGSELHFHWQLPVASSLVCLYCSMLSTIYYVFWQYYETDRILMEYIPFIVKFPIDVLLLSLTAHRAIKSSQLIGCMGVENVLLVENDKWHKQMDHFLYHINLYELKLQILGLFDISNALTLTFIGGILTAISIFLPFLIKADSIKKILEQQN